MTKQAPGAGPAKGSGRGKPKSGQHCSRCGVALTAENSSRRSGYCDPCHAQIEGEIRNQRPL